jgi:hypothetical protein
MRKTGIFIGLGMAISLSIFIVAGVIYYNPVIRTSLFTLEEAKVSEQEAPKVEVEKVVTVEIEKPVELPLEVAVEKPVEPPTEVVVEKPVELPPEVVVEKPTVVVPEVKEIEPIVVEKEVEEIEIVELEVEEKIEEVEAVKEPRIPPAPVMRLSVTEYVAPVKAERVEIFNRPLYRVEEKPFQLERNLVALLPLKAKEKVDYIWTETTVEEGEPLFIDPIKFNELAFERHRIAVDEVLEQLNW